VGETRQRQVRRPRAAARLILRLDDEHRPSRARQRDRRRHAIGTGPDHDRIVRARGVHPSKIAPGRRGSTLYVMTSSGRFVKGWPMTTESMKEIVENIQSIYTIILALAIAEAFNQAIKESHPEKEKHATTFASWFECLHSSRIVSLIVFLLLAAPFFQGNQKYLYLQYIEPLHGPHPPKSVSSFWLNFDCLVFTVEAGLFFVMSRSLSARRWQQFYATIVVLMAVDFIWAIIEIAHQSAVPREWVWFDLAAMIVLTLIIVLDWFFIPYDRGKDLNIYCYVGVSLIAILGLAYGYFYQIDYLID
jgi:hypothetical protein